MNPQHVHWFAPAKLNLMLRVIRQRADGYHKLQSVFQFLERSDCIRFQLRNDSRIRNSAPIEGIKDSENLALMAAALLQKQARVPSGVDIDIHKTLPMGGGLGGGSSNAATTLLVLNRLWRIGMPVEELAELGLQLGADVPVFIHGKSAWAEGVGEQLSFFEPNECWHLVLIPHCHVSTAKIFRNSQLTRDAKAITIRDFVAGIRENTCQPLVSKLYPEVQEALDWLGGHAEGRMTGTGACVFAEFSTYEQAATVLSELPDNMQGFVSQGTNLSPLHKQLNAFTGAWPSG